MLKGGFELKTVAYFILFLFLIIIILPAVLVKSCDIISLPEEEKGEGDIVVKVYDHMQKRIIKMKLEEYIKGVVAAEMPAAFEKEALKAQAVAARTYTVGRLTSMGGAGCSSHPEADICTDPTHCQAWYPKDVLLKRWGLIGYYRYWKKISTAVEETRGLIITYKGNIIDPVFHSTSGGKTENSEDVWQNRVPYLRSVVSKYETHSPKFTETVSIPIQDFIKKLKEEYPDIELTKEALKDAINVVEWSEGGRIKYIRLGNKVVKGTDVRRIFGLNSTNFRWKIDRESIDITTIGYGHGVGMSQYGADGMAKNGSNFAEILKHYYTGVDIDKNRAAKKIEKPGIK
jgi:stage II sporulation protein D